MLLELQIKNFAIIDDMQISFSNGLTILSGETGAGKSIIINAINLLLGNRASAQLVRAGAQHAEIGALFRIRKTSPAAMVLEQAGYNFCDELFIRRIISANERHRIFINERLTTIKLLSSVTENLAGISGQHSHQALLKEDQHLLIVDQFGGLMTMRAKVKKLYHAIKPEIEALNALKQQQAQQGEHLSFLESQKKEIESASPQPGEDQELEQELTRLQNAETLFSKINASINELYNARNSMIVKLGQIKKNIDQSSTIDPQVLPYSKGITDTLFQLEDLTEGLRTYLKNLSFNENRFEIINSRLDILNRLKRKYGGSLENVYAHLETLNQELHATANLSGRIEAAQVRIKEISTDLIKHVLDLSQQRRDTIKDLAHKVEAELSFLNMEATRFSAEVLLKEPGQHTDFFLTTPRHKITENGIDKIRFLMAPNQGEGLKPLKAIASGGELSRVVLALKAILSTGEALETIIFDEVDAGIGGSTAEAVGQKIKQLAQHHQVICITHLPQIAKFGQQHYKIEKQIANERTHTTIQPLEPEERILEIARMLEGENPSTVIQQAAREMLQAG